MSARCDTITISTIKFNLFTGTVQCMHALWTFLYLHYLPFLSATVSGYWFEGNNLQIENQWLCVLSINQGHSQDFLKGVSKNSIKLPEQESGGTVPSRCETLNILIQNLTDCYI